jgi:subtilisin family serine protease
VKGGAFLVVAIAGLLGAPTAAAQTAPSDVLVRFKPGTGAEQRSAARDRARTGFEDTLPVPGLQRVDPEPGVSVAAAVAALERSPDVLYAEPNVVRRASRVPNDSLFAQQWALNSANDADIDAPEAWDITTGGSGATVAVVDTGVDAGHPDLAPNIWRNAREVAGNGVDDDRNGYVDDTRGWDFVDRDADPDDGEQHGTHVAGTAAARGNDGRGVAGVSWGSRIMPVRVLDAEGSGTVADLVEGYAYAARNGARVINASLGGSLPSNAEQDAIRRAPGAMFVVAAGNEGLSNDLLGSYPCNYDEANIVCVASTGRTDGLSSFSNWGTRTVDLAAPGEDILSTVPGGYASFSGTSMATPHVSGAAALVLSLVPSASVADLRASLLGGVDRRSGLSSRTVTGGRLSARGALTVARSRVRAPAPAPARPATAPVPPALTLGISVARRQSLARVLRRGLRVRMRCSSGCRLSARALLDRRSARRLRLGSGRRTVRLGATSRSLSGAGARTLSVRFGRRSRARLRRVRSVKVTLELRARDSRGQVRSAKRRVLLRR